MRSSFGALKSKEVQLNSSNIFTSKYDGRVGEIQHFCYALHFKNNNHKGSAMKSSFCSKIGTQCYMKF